MKFRMLLIIAIALLCSAAFGDATCETQGMCATCMGGVGHNCVYGLCVGICDCMTYCHVIPDHGLVCACGAYGGGCETTVNSYGDPIKQCGIGQSGAKPQCAGEKLDEAMKAAYPWITSETFVAALVAHSNVPEVRDLAWGLQQLVKAKGLAKDMHMQMGTLVKPNAPAPKSLEDNHLRRLVGLSLEYEKDGSHLLSVFVEDAPTGETKHKTIMAALKDGITPAEVFRVKGNQAENTATSEMWSF